MNQAEQSSEPLDLRLARVFALSQDAVVQAARLRREAAAARAGFAAVLGALRQQRFGAAHQDVREGLARGKPSA